MAVPSDHGAQHTSVRLVAAACQALPKMGRVTQGHCEHLVSLS